MLENVLLFARQELEYRAFYTSLRKGDVGAMELLLQLWCPQFLAGQQSKYGNELLDIRCGMLAEWNEELQRVVRSNWVINPWGKKDKWLALDEMMEELVRAMKEQFSPGGSDDMDSFTRKTVCRCIIYFMAIKEDIRHGLGLRRRSGHHIKGDKKPDVRALVRHLMDHQIVKYVGGRGMPQLGNVSGHPQVRDLYSEGVVRLVNGKFWRDFLLRSPGCAGGPVGAETMDIRGNGTRRDSDSSSDSDVALED